MKFTVDNIIERFRPRIEAVLAGQPVTSIRHNAEGLANDVFIVNEALVVRFAKNESSRRILQAETAILERIRPHIPLAVPAPFYTGEDVVAYPLLAGETLSPILLRGLPASDRQAVARQLGEFLSALHAIPLDEHLPASPAPIHREDWLAIRLEVEEKVVPLLLSHQVTWAETVFDEALQPGFFDYSPALIHGDLGPYHILFDRTSRSIRGIIDFGVAGSGDPALDLGNLIQIYGETFVKRVFDHYPNGARYLPRARFYAQSIELQWALKGLKTGQPFWFTAHLGSARDIFPHSQDGDE